MPSQLLDLLKYNLLMSNRELQGSSIYSARSSIHELKVKWSNIEGLKDGPIASYISILASAYC